MLIREAVRRYLNALATQGRNTKSIRESGYILDSLCVYLDTQRVTCIAELSHDVLMGYREELMWSMTKRGEPLSAHTQRLRLDRLRGLCRYLVGEEWLMSDPSARIPLPKEPKRLPRAMLDEGQVRQLIESIDTRSALGFRNRVLLEMLYSTGLRRAEIALLKTEDLDPEQGLVWVRQGKGGKDRVVPLGRSVCGWVERYLKEVRASWRGASHTTRVFLSWRGLGLTPNGINDVMREVVSASGLQGKVTPHSLRHACATHMLRNGAGLRHLQELLGHASLHTTQVYTQVTIVDLKAVHEKFHPREQLLKKADGESD
jgi:integrase/recombinase XerD